MAVEMFSWPSLHERMCRTWGSNSGAACMPSELTSDRAPGPLQVWRWSDKKWNCYPLDNIFPIISLWKLSGVCMMSHEPDTSLGHCQGHIGQIADRSLAHIFLLKHCFCLLKFLFLCWYLVNLYLSHVIRKPVFAMCGQQRRTSACASIQSDQCLCCSLPRYYNTSTYYSRNFKTLIASLAEQAGLSLPWSQTPKTGFLVRQFICNIVTKLFLLYEPRHEK